MSKYVVYCEQLSAGFVISSVNTVSGNCQIIVYIINYYSKEKYKETMKQRRRRRRKKGGCYG